MLTLPFFLPFHDFSRPFYIRSETMKTIGYSFSHVRSLMNRYRDDPTTEVCV